MGNSDTFQERKTIMHLLPLQTLGTLWKLVVAGFAAALCQKHTYVRVDLDLYFVRYGIIKHTDCALERSPALRCSLFCFVWDNGMTRDPEPVLSVRFLSFADSNLLYYWNYCTVHYLLGEFKPIL